MTTSVHTDSSWWPEQTIAADVRKADRYATDNTDVVMVWYKGEVGTARRHPDDQFDFGIGFNLAMSRAMQKHATKVAKEARSLKHWAYETINRKES